MLKVLALGIATFKMIMILLNEVYGYGISETALMRRLSILCRAGYVATRKEPFRQRHGCFAVYALTKKSAQVLAELGYPLESIRMELPASFFVRHDLKVTAVLHVIHFESSKGHYKYNFIDSSVLKKYREKNSKDAIPDLQVTIRLKTRNIDMNIEVDLGTVLIPKMVTRLADQTKFKRLVVILFDSAKRLQNLRDPCYRANFEGIGRLLFGELEDFLKYGFVQTRFRTVTNESSRLKLDDER